MSAVNYVIAGVVVSATALIGYLVSKTQAPASKAQSVGAKLPPGPKQNAVIGNLANFPQEYWYRHFCEWQKQFGDLVFINLNIAGVTMLVVNSWEIAEELAGRRTKIYSGRPYTTMVSDLMYTGWTLLGLSVGPSFYEQRRVARKAVGPTGAPQYDALIREQIAKLLEILPTTTGNPFDVITPAVGEIIGTMAYGHDFYESHGSEIINLSLENIELLASIMSKFWVVDLFPFARYIPSWFPGATFRRIGQRGTYMGKRIRFEPFEFIEKRMAEGRADDSIITRTLQDHTLSKEHVRDITVTMVSAGVDTTSTAATHFLYAMAMYPECQKRVQEELDAYGRPPTYEELEALPYFHAAFKESLRWNAPAPLGVPHMATEEDVWQGNYIPKGCFLHFNIGFMTRDPRIWGEDAGGFNPDRFLSSQLPDPSTMIFGFGRRICAGRFLALRIVMQLMAAILSAYDIVPCEMEDGKALTPEATTYIDNSGIRRVANFQCRYVPRSA